tara:strand:+ start:90 stop:317 length:228 start_codon:yes stop_codon:yes gene_type:complete
MANLDSRDIEQLTAIFKGLVTGLVESMQHDIASINDRMNVLEKRYVQFGEPHRRDIEKTIQQHQHMIDRLQYELQ